MKKRLLWLFPLGIVILILGGFTIWAYTPLGPLPMGLEALQSDASISVSQVNGWLVFRPLNTVVVTTGFIIYPGGRVDYRAYAPTARAIAAQGNLVVLTRMPFNLAVFGAQTADKVILAYPEVKNWAVGGHSLGGAMGAAYVYQNPGKVKGLVLWASYPAESNDLSDAAIQVVSIYGTEDGLATSDKIAASRQLLPADTIWVEIPGGNHAQFGWYGPQKGDNPTAVALPAQQYQITEATAAFLKALGDQQ